MSFFKGTLIAAFLFASLLAIAPIKPAQAQAGDKPANVGNPVGLTGPEQRIALVIGNSNYQNVAQLPNPANDAKAVAQLLNSAGFEVISATDLDHNQMIQVIQDFSAKIAGHGRNTVAMIYYAGHGVQIAGENYLIPVDARISSEPDLINGSVRLVDVMATLETIPSRMRIVILDACRNNPFPTLGETGRGLAIVDAPNGSIVGYSTAPGTEALDGAGDHSPYTAAFLQEAHQKNLPIEQLFKRVRLDVNNSTDGQQTPWESSSLTSDFYFFGDTAVAATQAPARVQTAYAADDLPSRAVRQAYDYVLAENSVDNYQEFIRLYPHDPLCDRIRALLASLMLAQAWHNAVITNSPVGYYAFYDKYSNSPYAQNALKLAVQPKLIPLSQPKQILLPPTVKLGGLGSQGGFVSVDKTAVEKLGNGGQIVTLKPIGTNAALGNNGAGKIVELPNVNKTGTLQDSKLNGTLQNSKLNGEVAHIDGRPAKFDDRPGKSFSHVDSQPTEFRKSSFANAGGSFRTAQFHGPAFQPMGRSGGMMMRR